MQGYHAESQFGLALTIFVLIMTKFLKVMFYNWSLEDGYDATFFSHTLQLKLQYFISFSFY